MNSQDIKALLIKKGIKQVDIAESLSLSRYTISHVISKRGTSRRVQAAIATAVEKPYQDVWGEI